MKRKNRIHKILKKKLFNFDIIIEDNSFKHKGHNNFDGKQETHIALILKAKNKVVDYNNLATKTSNKNDNVTILLLNLLLDQKVKEVYLAGFDGYRFGSDNYSYTEYDRIVERKVMEQQN